MHRIYSFLLFIFHKLNKFKNLNIFSLDFKIKLKGRFIKFPTVLQLHQFNKLVFRKLNLFPYSISTLDGFMMWEDSDKSEHIIHTINIEHISAVSSAFYAKEWISKYNWVLDFKTELNFSNAKLLFINQPVDGVLRLAILSRPDRHFGRASYYKWIAQVLLLFELRYIMFKPKLNVTYYDKSIIHTLFDKDNANLLEKLRTKLLNLYNVIDLKPSVLNAYRIYKNKPDHLIAFLWNNEIFREVK